MELFRKDRLKPVRKEPPAVAVIHMDAGKIQMRSEGGGPGVREPHWCDTKVASLATYPRARHRADPQPEPPRAFLDPPAVARLAAEVERVRNRPETLAVPEAAGPPKAPPPPEEEAVAAGPKPLVRTAVATLGDTDAFGWLVATAAHLRNFYRAAVKALVGDGGNWIGPLGEMHLPGFLQILDFLHLLVHLYAAATSAWSSSAQRTWGLYEKLLRAAWAGRVAEVLRLLKDQQDRIGTASKGAGEADPRRQLELVIGYVQSNASRMDYPRYRRLGLPVTSALVESLVKQLNQRVKGTEKFWQSGGAEAVLQIRAAYLSEDGRAEAFHARRPAGRAAGAHRLRRAA